MGEEQQPAADDAAAEDLTSEGGEQQEHSPLEAALALRDGFPGVRFLSALRRGNVHGALDMGLSPGLLPGRTTLAASRAAFVDAWPNVPTATGLDATGILEAAASGRITTLVLLGADPLQTAHHQRAIAAGIASGAAEIQLNLAARRHLNLPGDK